MSSDHPFDPGDRKFPMLLPIGGMILLGITTTTLGFVCWPEPKPHHDISTEGTFPLDAAPRPDPAPAAAPPATGATPEAEPATDPETAPATDPETPPAADPETPPAPDPGTAPAPDPGTARPQRAPGPG